MIRHWSDITTSFWMLQLLGWGAYGLLWYLASLPVYEALDVAAWIPVVRMLYYITIGCTITMLLRLVYRRLWAQHASVTTLLIAAVVGSLFGTLLWLMLFEGMKWPLEVPAFQGASAGYFARPFLSNSFVLLSWSALYFGIKYEHDLRDKQNRVLRAEMLSREAQLQMLRYQLNPHFLFNTLNTLRTLIGREDERAKRMVSELSDFLRYSLLDLDASTIRLRDEIDVTRAYMSIEKIRFEEQLQVEYDIDPAAEACPVPPLLVHSLVENAVKHGMATTSLPLRVRLSAARIGEAVRIEVTNTGRLTDSSSKGSFPSNGIGLSNVRQRLQQLYPGRHRLSLTEDGGWVRARIEIMHPAPEAATLSE